MSPDNELAKAPREPQKKWTKSSAGIWEGEPFKGTFIGYAKNRTEAAKLVDRINAAIAGERELRK